MSCFLPPLYHLRPLIAAHDQVFVARLFVLFEVERELDVAQSDSGSDLEVSLERFSGGVRAAREDLDELDNVGLREAGVEADLIRPEPPQQLLHLLGELVNGARRSQVLSADDHGAIQEEDAGALSLDLGQSIHALAEVSRDLLEGLVLGVVVKGQPRDAVDGLHHLSAEISNLVDLRLHLFASAHAGVHRCERVLGQRL